MGLCSSKKQGLTAEQYEQLHNAELSNTPMEVYNFTVAKVIDVYDGDTFTIAAWHGGQLTKFPVRLFGVDTPEMKDRDERIRESARQAKKFVEDKLLGRIIKIQVLNNKKYDGKIIREKYGRLLARVEVDGEDLTQRLIAMGYNEYSGGTKSEHLIETIKH